MIEKQAFLQINATIVAGLLILLTITTISTESILDVEIKRDILSSEYETLLVDSQQIKTAIDMIEKGETITCNSGPEDSHVTFDLCDIPLDIHDRNNVMGKLFEENYRERIKLIATLEAHEQLSDYNFLSANPIFLVSLMIIPFLGAILVETVIMLIERIKSHSFKKETSILSLSFFSIGIFFMVGFFFMGSYYTILYDVVRSFS